MPTKILMPQLGESVVEGTIGKWLKKEGDAVEEYEPILEVTTDKVDTEVTASDSGVLLKIEVPDGATVTAGTVLGWIGEPGEALPGDGEPAAGRAPAPQPTDAPAPALRGQKELGFISPVVAKLAAEHGVNLAEVKGTGASGRITKKDVLAFVELRGAAASPAVERAPTTAPPAHEMAAPRPASGDTVAPLSAMRRSIAEHMIRSQHTAAHVTTVFEADLSRVAAHREANKAVFARNGVNLTYAAYFVAACVPALQAHPAVNSSFAGDKLLLKRDINIGVAVSLGDEGLIVPVIKRADEKSLLAIAREVNDLAQRARNKQLKPDDVQGGTFTITNHGVSGSLFATPIINQPQCGILGVGAIQKRAVVVNDAIAIRPMVYISLTFDHRILDGATADYFLAKVKETLEGWA